MKLKEFNPENSITTRASRVVPPSLRIGTKSGVFTLNRPAMDLIGISEKDYVLIHQDEEEPDNWYLEIAKKGFPCRTNDKKTEIKFNSAFVARAMAKSVGFEGSYGRVLIAGTPTKVDKRKFWGILTVGLKNY